MSYKDLSLKVSYETGIDNLVEDFYNPALCCAVSYDRIAGFFSSSCFAIAAQGLAGLIQNNGEMRLLTSPRLNAEDAEILKKLTASEKSEFVGSLMTKELDSIQDEFEMDHVRAFGWLLAQKRLQMRVVCGNDKDLRIMEEKLFHQKVGILTDEDGNSFSFSGSNNESATGWLGSIEEFKVFKNWIDAQQPYFDSDKARFEGFWNGTRSYVSVIDIPQAVEQRLIKAGESFSLENYVARNYLRNRKKKTVEENLSLFDYQKAAMDQWMLQFCQMIFEMATGSGKTRTALACVNHAMKQEKKLVVVIACPQITLANQWQTNEVEPAGFLFDEVIIADGSHRKWRSEFNTALKKIGTGYFDKIIVYTTHSTASSKDFTSMIENSHPDICFCLVGDEVHGLGAPKSRRALLDRYQYRIGLSATPVRWFDECGTAILFDFFGTETYRFSIADGLSTINPITKKTFLVNYYYYPIFVTLSEEELDEYAKLTNRIRRLGNCDKTDEAYQKRYESLLFARANIQKNAVQKYSALYEILSQKSEVKNTLIFVSPEQIDRVLLMLKELHILAHRFTEKQGTAPKAEFGGISERQQLIASFKEGFYKALVAISCLDEGIDIPTADCAFLLANSSNPREYIQRIGRVIRQAPGKEFAYIYDFIVAPDNMRDCPPEVQAFERSIFEKELLRAHDMARNARNNATVQELLDQKLEEVSNYGTQ